MGKKTIYLIGYASGAGGVDVNCGLGPLSIKNSLYLSQLQEKYACFHWESIITSEQTLEPYQLVKTLGIQLATTVSNVVRDHNPYVVLGGDHTSALGTWSGLYDAKHQEGDIGLIWFDAHMDSHTPETSETGRIHGMPLACLLGYGPKVLTDILHPSPKIKPENLCLVGVRSYEPGEEALLKKLNVKVFNMEEIAKRGFKDVLQRALAIVSKSTVGYGISFDLDCVDPTEAPGVDVPEPNGIPAKDMLYALQVIVNDPLFLGCEIVEFNPYRDIDQKTEKLVIACLNILASGSKKSAI